jgi:hypothetical protein
MAQDQPSGTDFEALGDGMAPNVAKKPTVEYDGYERTITQVVRTVPSKTVGRSESGSNDFTKDGAQDTTSKSPSLSLSPPERKHGPRTTEASLKEERQEEGCQKAEEEEGGCSC